MINFLIFFVCDYKRSFENTLSLKLNEEMIVEIREEYVYMKR